MIERNCLSVAGGWQSHDQVTGLTFGPVFNEVNDLWNWQKANPVEGKKVDRKSTRLNSSHSQQSRMPSSA